MIEFKKISQKNIAFISLTVAILALPFSIKVCHIAILFFLVCWICEGEWRAKFEIFKQNILLQLIIGLFIVEAFSLLYINTSGLPEIEKKIFLLLLPLALATTNLKLTPGELDTILYLFVGSCFVGSLVCLGNAVYQIDRWTEGWFNLSSLTYLDSSDFKILNPGESDKWFFLSYRALADGIGIHPTYFSLYIAFGIIFLFFKLWGRSLRSRIISWALIAYFSFFIVLLSSRIIIIGLLIIFVVIMVRATISHQVKATALPLLALLLLCSFLLYINPISRYRNLQEITITSLDIESNTLYKNSTQIRASLWWLGVKSYTRVNPIWGTGTDDVFTVMKQTSDEYNVTNTLDSYDPHNQYLFTLIGLGLLGLTLLLGLMAFSIYSGLAQHNYLFVAFILLFCLLCTTETALELQKGIAFFALFFPLLAFSQPSRTIASPILNTVEFV